MTRISHRLSADDVRLRTVIGSRESNLIRNDGTKRGIVLYGPYITLAAGHYKAVIRFDPSSPCQRKAVATMDVCSGGSTNRLASQSISAEQIHEQGMSASIYFSAGHDLRNVEVRLICDKGFVATIQSVEIFGDSLGSLPNLPNSFSLPKGLRICAMTGVQQGYFLAFSDTHSAYEAGVERLGAPDNNARLLMALLGGAGTLVDVGANIGTIAVPVAIRGSSVIAVEMNPENCLKLWIAAEANRLQTFHIVQAAASDHDGMVKFTGREAWGHVNEEGIPALSLRIDTILSRFRGVPDPIVFKLDVEGHEAAVLRGAGGTLQRVRPIVLFEALEIEGAAFSQGRAAKLLLEGAGYELYLTRGNILCPRTAMDMQEGHVTDFLGVPRERRSVLDTLGANGVSVRQFTLEERLKWITEMVSGPGIAHQRHAAGVLLRLEREDPELSKSAAPMLPDLIALEHLSDLHDNLRRLLAGS